MTSYLKRGEYDMYAEWTWQLAQVNRLLIDRDSYHCDVLISVPHVCNFGGKIKIRVAEN